MATDHKIIKHPPKFKGLNKSVNSTDLPTGYAEEVKNAVVNSDGSLSKRKGFKTNLETDKGIFGMEVYNNVEGNTVTEELIVANTHLNKLKKNNFTVSYAKPYSNSYHSLYLNSDTSTYFYEIYDVTTDTQVLKLDLGTENLSKYTVQQVLDEINLIRTPIFKASLNPSGGQDQYVNFSESINQVLLDNIKSTLNTLKERYISSTGLSFPTNFDDILRAAETYLDDKEKATLLIKTEDSFLMPNPEWRQLAPGVQSEIDTDPGTSHIHLASNATAATIDADGTLQGSNGLGLGKFEVGDLIQITNTANTQGFTIEAEILEVVNDSTLKINTSLNIANEFTANGGVWAYNYILKKQGTVKGSKYPIFVGSYNTGTQVFVSKLLPIDEEGKPIITYLDGNGDKQVITRYQSPFGNKLSITSTTPITINEFYSYEATYDGSDASLPAARLSFASRNNLFPRHTIFTSELEILPKALNATQLETGETETEEEAAARQKALKEAIVMPAYDYYTDDSILNKDVLRNAGFTVLNNVMYIGNGHDDMLKYDGNLVYKPGLPQFDKSFVTKITDAEADATVYYTDGKSTKTTASIGTNDFKYNYIFRFSYEDAKGNFITGEPSDPIEISSRYSSFKANEYEHYVDSSIFQNTLSQPEGGNVSLSLINQISTTSAGTILDHNAGVVAHNTKSVGILSTVTDKYYYSFSQGTDLDLISGAGRYTSPSTAWITYEWYSYTRTLKPPYYHIADGSLENPFIISTSLNAQTDITSGLFAGQVVDVYTYDSNTYQDYATADSNGDARYEGQFIIGSVEGSYSFTLYIDPDIVNNPNKNYNLINGNGLSLMYYEWATSGSNPNTFTKNNKTYSTDRNIVLRALSASVGVTDLTRIKDTAPNHVLTFDKQSIEEALTGFDCESLVGFSEQTKQGTGGYSTSIDIEGRKLQIEIYRTKMYNPGGNALEVAGQYYYVGNISYDGNVTSANTDFTFTDNKADEAGFFEWLLVDETSAVNFEINGLTGKGNKPATTGISASSESSLYLNPFLIFTENYKRHDPPPKGALLTTFKNCLVVSGNSENLNNIQYSLPFNVLTGEIGSEYFPENDNGFLVESVSGDRINAILGVRDVLYVFHDGSIHTVIGNIANPVGIPFSLDLLTDEGAIATRNQESVTEFRNQALFLSEKGVYNVTASTALQEMSLPIKPLILDTSLDYQRAKIFNWAKFNLLIFSIPRENIDAYTDIISTKENVTFVYDYVNDAWLQWDNTDFTGGIKEMDDTVYFATRSYNTDTNKLIAKLNIFSTSGTDSDYNDNLDPVDFSYATNFESLGAPTVFKKFLRLKVHTFDNSEIYKYNVKNNLTITLHTDYIKNYKATFNIDASKNPFGEGVWNFFVWGGSGVAGKKHKLLRNKCKSLMIEFKNNNLGENVKLNTYELEVAAPFRQEIKE